MATSSQTGSAVTAVTKILGGEKCATDVRYVLSSAVASSAMTGNSVPYQKRWTSCQLCIKLLVACILARSHVVDTLLICGALHRRLWPTRKNAV